TDAEVQKEFIKQNVKVKFDYGVLTPDSIAKQINPNEAELRKYYQANLARLKDSIPEQRKVRLVVVDAAKVAAQAKPTQEERQRYQRWNAGMDREGTHRR